VRSRRLISGEFRGQPSEAIGPARPDAVTCPALRDRGIPYQAARANDGFRFHRQALLPRGGKPKSATIRLYSEV
jgi:hypothetical protein